MGDIPVFETRYGAKTLGAVEELVQRGVTGKVKTGTIEARQAMVVLEPGRKVDRVEVLAGVTISLNGDHVDENGIVLANGLEPGNACRVLGHAAVDGRRVGIGARPLVLVGTQGECSSSAVELPPGVVVAVEAAAQVVARPGVGHRAGNDGVTSVAVLEVLRRAKPDTIGAIPAASGGDTGLHELGIVKTGALENHGLADLEGRDGFEIGKHISANCVLRHVPPGDVESYDEVGHPRTCPRRSGQP